MEIVIDGKKIDTNNEIVMEKIGNEIAHILCLTKIKTGLEKGRFRTNGGTKTDIGLARTIIRTISET